MFNALEPWHIIVLVVVLIALFGYKRLPDAARGIGQSMRIFKKEAQSLRDDANQADAAQQATAAPQQYAPQQYAAPLDVPPQPLAAAQSEFAAPGAAASQPEQQRR